MLFWVLLVCVFGVRKANAYIEPIELPDVLRECYDVHTRNVSITEVPSQRVVFTCIYNLEIENIRDEYDMGEDAKRYLESLLRKVIGREMQEEFRRQKRQTDIRDSFAVRREIRMYSDSEWATLAGRLNDLKRSTDVRPNRYDAIAGFHRGSTIQRAHRGPAFLPWHRIYLLLIEAALEMPIPYWNSTIDFLMGNPSETVIFSPERLGNGRGNVVTGPFANWGINRNIGGDGSLISPPMRENVLSRRFHSEISEGTSNTNTLFSLEAAHNGVHVWVGGTMSGTQTAAFDPVFFMHHAFIDYLWQIFRLQQSAQGIDSSRDYPSTLVGGHRANDRMAIFRRLRNRAGFENRYATITEYADLPPCPACGNLFGMSCIIGRCMAEEPMASFGFAAFGSRAGSLMGMPDQASTRLLPIGTVEQFNPTVNAVELADTGDASRSNVPFSNFINSFIDLRTRNNQGLARRKRFAPEARPRLQSIPHERELTSDELNDFVIDGVSDHNRWVYVNVAVYYNRFRYSGNVRDQPATFDHCARTPPGGAKVWVQSDGISYSGRYKDSVTFQSNDQSLLHKVMIGIRKPDNASTEVYITAHDTCGRACFLDCSSFGQGRCTGAFRISQDFPYMYQNNNYLSELESPIIFNCDMSTKWPQFSMIR